MSLLVAGLFAAPAAADFDDAPPSTPEDAGRYVVLLEDVPLVTEFGADGVNSAEAQARGAEFVAEQTKVAASAGISSGEITYSYTAALNGFGAELTAGQVTKLKNTDGVLMVLKDTLRQPQTDSSGDFLGLTGRGEAHLSGLTGEGVIMGVIDSGIWPENPSFADDGTYPDLGIVLDESTSSACDFGNTEHREDDAPFTCNNKLLGARNFTQSYRAQVGADPSEFDSARDDDGHGSHTASTAAGNANVEAVVDGRKIGKISGVAPRARIIAYKACGALGCAGLDLAAAIDQAVFDGVDVINYSIGGGAGSPGPDSIAFLFAADAGVHVATSAGNSGPGLATMGDPASKPWLTAVGASTQERFFAGEVRYNKKTKFVGASLTSSLGRANIVDAEFAGGDLCIPGTLDPEVVEGNIVLCRRGAIARVGKSNAVAEAGGVGMVMYNNTDSDNLFTDPHIIPSVHLNNTDGVALKEYIAARPNARPLIATGMTQKDTDAPSMTFFSSRGPNPASPDIIKPDVTAPGLQILAAYTPNRGAGDLSGDDFASIAGTSMSSPHVAGLMALLDQAHPDWSAAAVKSALMTTAYQDVLKEDRVTPADPFDFGAGHVDIGRPSRNGSAFKPGLVYEAGFLDYLGFMCDAHPETLTDPSSTCPALEGLGIAIEAENLNYPSIGVSELVGSQVITRMVTSVAAQKHAVTYRPKVEAPEGYEVEVTPSSMKLKPGQSATFQLTITNVSAPIGEWRHGSITWKGGNYEVRSPISVRGVQLAAPSSVAATGTDGNAVVPVTFGYGGEYSAAGHGLEASTVFSGMVDQDPDQTFDPSDLGSGAEVHEVTTEGAAALLIKMPPEATDAGADIDIFVYGPAGDLIGASTSGGTDEEIIFALPDDGTYEIWVHGWQTDGPDSPYDLYTWTISATPGGNLSVDSAPTTVSPGQTADVEVSWTGATEGEWHIGAVSHSNGEGLLGLTLIDVDNR